jgi:RUN domain
MRASHTCNCAFSCLTKRPGWWLCSERKLYNWLYTLLDSAQVVLEHYREGALVLDPCARRNFLSVLAPLADLPFSLSIDFEWRVPV